MKNKLITTMLIAGIALSCNPVKKTTNDTPVYSNPTADSSIAIAQAVADGKSFETAIVIHEKTETPGVHAEYQWIRDHYSNYKIVLQSLATHGKKPFDIITIELADSSKQEIYFDISKFFGHL
jgi:hypothetical protein